MNILDEVSKMSAEEQMAMASAIQKAASDRLQQNRSDNLGKSVEVVVQGLKKIKSDLETRFDELNNVMQTKVGAIAKGRDGEPGRDGKDGKDGRIGVDGIQGPPGISGQDGKDGEDGISVANAFVDFDGGLTIVLSDGREINAGEVIPMDVAEKIKVITNGGGTSQSVLDSIASLQAQITAMAGFVNYEGTWNASTNTPTLVSSVGTKGDYYVVSTTGTTNLNGITAWTQGDWAIFNGSVWEKVDNTDLVTSVAGRTGAVTLSTTDISGLGTMSTQNANAVAITGGSITALDSNFTLQDDADPTKQAQFQLSAIATGTTGTYTLPAASATLAGLGTAQTFSAANIFSNTTTFSGNVTMTSSSFTRTATTQNLLDGSMTTGYWRVGGTAQTGDITLGRSTAAQTLNIATGATATATTKTLNIGTAGLSGSTTAISIGSAVSGATTTVNAYGTWTFNTQLNQNTTGSAGSVATANFSIVESGGVLLFKYGTTTIASMSSTGVITSATNIVSNGTP
jgi:hypothetical protein